MKTGKPLHWLNQSVLSDIWKFKMVFMVFRIRVK